MVFPAYDLLGHLFIDLHDYVHGEKGTHNRLHHQLLNLTGFDIAMASDLTESLAIEIPAAAPASLKELQTIVTWKIVVHRKTASGSADRDYVFRVIGGDEAAGTWNAPGSP